MNDLEALQFAQRVLPEYSEAERQLVTVIGRFETNWGAGWVTLARQLGAPNPEAFEHVNNIGAIMAPPPPSVIPAFFMRDRWWRIYDSPESGWKDAAATILKPNVRAAIKRGDGSGAVRAMGQNGYYIEPNKDKKTQIRAYTKQVAANYDDMIRHSGAPGLLRFTGSGLGLRISDFLIGAAFVGGTVAAILLLGGNDE